MGHPLIHVPFQVSLSEKTQNVRRLEAQRNELNAKVRLLREELQLLQEQGSHVGEVIKPMDKKKVLVKVGWCVCVCVKVGMESLSVYMHVCDVIMLSCDCLNFLNLLHEIP